ncbi:Inner membrane protein YiaW [Rubripirellula lacrimiformis]|uniref:Inner membrane protein YiaW n=1 Tax=Rubripirellula lacrimiformis TaxID=1930273 RepID=A0A517N5Q1_9BACT|nr:DUF3302 domain-containing protein [Rubripirellula lacrimiformis]QDT02466.1 Inner membrane protein YiaW [Rubripirellula lacrimiformis]
MAEYPFASIGDALHLIALLAIFVFIAVAAFVLLALAALPGQIAARRSHPQTAAVNVCGWLGLPTGGFWIAALVWAYWNYDRPEPDSGVLSAQITRLEEVVRGLEQQRPSGSQPARNRGTV